ncbi:CPBP family intramembrane metalloprotease [Infirmifilum lucidum]|uniref:CPBP family intramembrane metalloprotease n=1 Tax=Infirmifilum lucidum TaxID=2776706 RepID=A0A7L9FKT5_9CREN|nr:CPBP family intramembrane metalloprotease [Infirmifilum lucidum]QOJ79476.1 CPBP family intramembrane metalloprotease [Infirmifilum lucidum]
MVTFRSKAEELWLAVFLAYFSMANAGLVLAGYALLLLYSAAVVIPRLRDPPRVSRADSVLLVLLGVLPHVLLLASRVGSAHSLHAYLFACASAVIEEIFYRGFLLQRIGLPLQALVFMYSHISATDPVFLVYSSLLAPHYFLIGLAAGLLAERMGFEGSSVFHSVYNVVASSYYLRLDIPTLSAIIASDLLLLALIMVYLKLPSFKIDFLQV